jgi:allophanate hydrolase subunit 2
MYEGVPYGGALVPEMLSRANAAARNAPNEPAIEAFGTITIVARRETIVASDDGEPRALHDGEAYSLAGRRTFARFVAVRGGIDVPHVLGGRGTLVVAGLGGHEGRALRRGDVLRIGAAPPDDDGALPPPIDIDESVQVVLGPDLDRFSPSTIEIFLASTFAIDARSDRVGTRLTGPRIVCEHGPTSPSVPMVRGAIQVPPSGEPIVLGPDHPTTGGYAVIATVTRRHLGPLGARPIGAAVRFFV